MRVYLTLILLLVVRVAFANYEDTRNTSSNNYMTKNGHQRVLPVINSPSNGCSRFSLGVFVFPDERETFDSGYFAISIYTSKFDILDLNKFDWVELKYEHIDLKWDVDHPENYILYSVSIIGAFSRGKQMAVRILDLATGETSLMSNAINCK